MVVSPITGYSFLKTLYCLFLNGHHSVVPLMLQDYIPGFNQGMVNGFPRTD
jgi:hypothetical protein